MASRQPATERHQYSGQLLAETRIELLVQAAGDNGVTGSSSTRLSRRPEQDLREEISHRLARDIIELVGG